MKQSKLPSLEPKKKLSMTTQNELLNWKNIKSYSLITSWKFTGMHFVNAWWQFKTEESMIGLQIALLLAKDFSENQADIYIVPKETGIKLLKDQFIRKLDHQLQIWSKPQSLALKFKQISQLTGKDVMEIENNYASNIKNS